MLAIIFYRFPPVKFYRFYHNNIIFLPPHSSPLKIFKSLDSATSGREKSRLLSAIKMTVSSGHSHSVSGTPGHFYIHIRVTKNYLISIHILSPE